MLRALLLDMDGVVIDSEAHWQSIEPHLLSTVGIELTNDLQRSIVGVSLKEAHRRVTTWTGAAITIEEFTALYDQAAETIYVNRASLFPGVLELIERARVEVGLVALCSSSPHRWINHVLERFRLRSKLDAIVSSDDVAGVGKPSPAVYLEALRILGLPSTHCIAVEDSKNGILAARTAGVRCVGFVNGQNYPEDVADADLVVSELCKIDLTFLRSWLRGLQTGSRPETM